jgi:uncharacterized membrane protein (UPF0127 family)
MAWLLRRGEVLASVDVPTSVAARARGLAGRRADVAALLLEHRRWAHSLAAPGALDLAFLDRDLVVVASLSLAKNRIARPRLGARHVLLAPSGAFDRWMLRPGDRLERKE